MKVVLLKLARQNFNVTAIELDVPVNYGTEDMPVDFPFREDNRWKVTIDVKTGRIKGWKKAWSEKWPKGLDLYMNVGDGGKYKVVSGTNELISIEGNYIPSWVPNEYSDTLQIKIYSDGSIHGWDPNQFVKLLEEYSRDRIREEME